MKNNNYVKPSMKMITFEIEDVITTSGPGGLNNKGDGTADGTGSIGGEFVFPDPEAATVLN